MELPDRLRRETDWQERAFRLAGRHREELAAALGTPPDLDRVPQSLWRKIEDDWAALLLLMLLRTAIDNSTRHGHDPDRGGTIGRITQWASDLSRRRAVDFAANTGKAIEGKIKGDWNRDATNARGELGEMLETRARGLIVTEFTTASVYGGEFATGIEGVRHPDDTWKTHPERSATGPCPVCAPLNGQPRTVWERDFPSGPPSHPRCVCTIAYVLIGTP